MNQKKKYHDIPKKEYRQRSYVDLLDGPPTMYMHFYGDYAHNSSGELVGCWLLS